MASRFLFNESLWEELTARVRKARNVRAAVAYLGTGASELLPLKKGDRLVVDMSLRSVRSGTTNPHEVAAFLKRGVHVFSRESLHAKFFICDEALIAGSSNISKHSRHVLNEAAILTDDPETVRQAVDTFETLCSEPVRKKYLEQCIQAYRPPQIEFSERLPTERRKQGKVWFVSGLEYDNGFPEEKTGLPAVLKEAEKRLGSNPSDLLDYEQTEVSYSRFPSDERFFEHLREGDWVILCIERKSGFDVWPPSKCLGIDTYVRGKGKKEYVLLLECPQGDEKISWSRLRKEGPPITALRRDEPKTGPVSRDADADALLRLWDTRGCFKGTKK